MLHLKIALEEFSRCVPAFYSSGDNPGDKLLYVCFRKQGEEIEYHGSIQDK